MALLFTSLFLFPSANSSGLYEQMFQITPDQEHSIVIGNMPSDGIIVMEMDSVVHLRAKLFSPEEDLPELALHLSCLSHV